MTWEARRPDACAAREDRARGGERKPLVGREIDQTSLSRATAGRIEDLRDALVIQRFLRRQDSGTCPVPSGRPEALSSS